MSARQCCEAVGPAPELARLIDELRAAGFRGDPRGLPRRVGRYYAEVVDEAANVYRLTWWQKREPKRRRRPRAGVAR